MSTDQEKSFIATCSTPFGYPHFPALTYGKKYTTLKLDYELLSFNSHMDVSNYLFLKPDLPADSLTFYFRCQDDYYTIYIFTKGIYYYMTLSNEEDDFLNAYATQDGDQTTFNLLNKNGEIVTLDDFANDSPTIRIQTRGGKLLRQGYSRAKYNPKIGTPVRLQTPKSQTVLDFKLNILQRNAPY